MDQFTGDPVTTWARATDQWLRFSTDVVQRAAEANRAAAAAFGFAQADAERRDSTLPSMAYRRDDWTFECTVDSREDIGVGEHVSFSKELTDDDVRAFAKASGDTNRLHLDDEFAARTRFGERIAHGTLVSGLVSAALARLPGLTIYLEQDVEYLAPVPIGERATATCEVVENLGGDRYRLTTVVTDGDGDAVVDGEAIVLVDELPA
ncbi:MaoC family dehydratase [Halobacterium litoreum]|uniref:MaoC family dehydratase n=1 Tax=Halobacterium litoreum TaxID=2039234 RepID=A0ABD5NBT7_9EURY|nr:MaoC family dehydratase [Halobacterium litoreum]UHH14546.1 MaoC family dehydratase [Halobacterium litoreum]